MASITRSGLLRQGVLSPQRLSTSRLAPKASRLGLHQPARIAAFHATSRRQILPPLPQTVQGTFNDPAPIPKANPMHGRYHWSAERLISIGIVPLTVAPFMGGALYPTVDAIFGALLILHSHIGFDACITDYFPKSRVPVLRTALEWILRAATVLSGIGLYSLETNDVGLTGTVEKIWKA